MSDNGRTRERTGARNVPRGTTAIEVLVVLSCVSLLAGVGGPAVRGAREGARRAECKNNLKQLALSLHYNHDVDKFFPPGSTNRASWTAFVLPYIDQFGLDRIVQARGGNNGGPELARQPTSDDTDIPMLHCPANPFVARRIGSTSYLASGGLQPPRAPMESKLRGVFRDESFAWDGSWRIGTDQSQKDFAGWSWRGNYFSFRDCTDGTSNTIALLETPHSNVAWCPPFDPRRNRTIAWMDGEGLAVAPNKVVSAGPPVVRSLIGSWHSGGVQACLVDGAVVFLTDATDPKVFGASLTIRGGEADALDVP